MERRDPTATDEATMLAEYLDWYRAGVVEKVTGLDHDQLHRELLPSGTTIGGLVKHLAGVEDYWFQCVLRGLAEVEPWSSAPWDDDPDWDFHSAADHSPDELVALYVASCDRSRAATVGLAPDHPAAQERDDLHPNLRWIMVHMIEETARHLGHLDVLRELTDGATGE
ncbi:MAG: DinB family protein [Actinomycetota bacterium]